MISPRLTVIVIQPSLMDREKQGERDGCGSEDEGGEGDIHLYVFFAFS